MNRDTVDLTPLRGLPDSSWAVPMPPRGTTGDYAAVSPPPVMEPAAKRWTRMIPALQVFMIIAVLAAGAALLVAVAPDMRPIAVPHAAVAPSVPIAIPLMPMPEGGEEKEAGEIQGVPPAAPSSISPAVPLSPPPALSTSSCTVKIGKPVLKRQRVKHRKRKQIRSHPLIEAVLAKAPPPPPPVPRHPSIANLIAKASPGKVAMKGAPDLKNVPLPPLTREQIMGTVTKISKDVGRCWDRFHVPGIVSTNFTIMPGGEVSGLKIHGIFSGTPTGACVAAAIGRRTFPKSGKPARITIPFVLR